MDLEWLIKFRDPADIYKHHVSFLYCEIIYYIFAFLTLVHAFRNGGRYPYLWITTVLHGLVVESISYFVPDIDSFWHAQGMIMFLGQRLPLYIVIVYPCFIYTASVAVSRLRLPRWAEPFAVGLCVVLIDLPYDILGIKHVYWTWHDTDPNIYDRHYWVPWTSYYFHASFACAFTFLYHGTHRLLSSKQKFQSAGFVREVLCVVLTGLFSMPLGILQFIPIYHTLHDNLHIHTEVCVILFLGTYFLITWMADRNPTPEARPNNKQPRKSWWSNEIGLAVLIHYLSYIWRVVFFKPEDVRSIGLHEKLGNCKDTMPVHTPFGQVLSKRKFLCAKQYDEGYFDFHCLPGGKAPQDGTEWYTICGNAYPNYAEYIVVVTAVCLFALFLFRMMLGCSGSEISSQPQKEKVKQK